MAQPASHFRFVACRMPAFAHLMRCIRFLWIDHLYRRFLLSGRYRVGYDAPGCRTLEECRFSSVNYWLPLFSFQHFSIFAERHGQRRAILISILFACFRERRHADGRRTPCDSFRL